MERNAVDQVLVAASNLAESGANRIYVGGMPVCWGCGLSDGQHSDRCPVGALIRAVKDYEQTPRYILGLDAKAARRVDFERNNPPARVGFQLTEEGMAEVWAVAHQYKDLDENTTQNVLGYVLWLEAELERTRGSKTFRDEVRSLLGAMRTAGGDATGLALYLYRKDGNQGVTGSDAYRKVVDDLVRRLTRVWHMLGGDPRKPS